MTPRAGSKALMREINEVLVLDAVRSSGTVARGTIAERTGLSPATVTGIVASLLRVGVLAEAELVRGTGGRPARLVTLGRDAVFAVGVRLGSEEALGVLVDLAGDVVASHREPVSERAPESAVAAIQRTIDALAAERPKGSIIGVGVAISGVIDHDGGIVRHSGTLGWHDVDLRSMLQSAMAHPVAIESHVTAFVTGLLAHDASVAGRDLLVVSLGVSVGAAVVVQGTIHRGFDGAAGGFAHWRATGSASAPCHCGARGCLETLASGWGIEQAIGAGEPSDAVISAAAEQLGVAVANASRLLAPELVRIAVAPDERLEAVAERAERSFAEALASSSSPAPRWQLAKTDPVEIARGAAASILAQVFAVPGARGPHSGVALPRG